MRVSGILRFLLCGRTSSSSNPQLVRFRTSFGHSSCRGRILIDGPVQSLLATSLRSSTTAPVPLIPAFSTVPSHCSAGSPRSCQKTSRFIVPMVLALSRASLTRKMRGFTMMTGFLCCLVPQSPSCESRKAPNQTIQLTPSRTAFTFYYDYFIFIPVQPRSRKA